jgi:phosphinothricin acetyltransferase
MIVPVEAQDIAAIQQILAREVREGVAHFGVVEPTVAEVEAQWLATRDRYPWLVARDGDVAVGFAKAGRWRERGAYDWTVETSVYVDPQAHGRGIGKALYAELLQRLSAAGVRTLVAGICPPNPASVRLHEALGFDLAGTLARVGYKHGRWRDIDYWVLHLGDPNAPPAAR